MKTIITYHSAKDNLAVLLTLLQAQMVMPEEIIVIDTSADKSGLEVVQKFTNRKSGVPVKVECSRVGIYTAWNLGIDLAGEDCDVLIMNDDLLVPLNFIDILGLVAMNVKAYAIVPNTPKREHYSSIVDMPFDFYAKMPENGEDIDIVDWMPGFCFYLSKECIKDVGLFDDKHYKCWFGDDDYQNRIKKKALKNNIIPIFRINSMFVYHYGGKSYKYQSKEVKNLIIKDRKNYAKKTKKSLQK